MTPKKTNPSALPTPGSGEPPAAPVAPAGSGDSGGSLYGLGDWKDQQISISGFPPQVVAALLQEWGTQHPGDTSFNTGTQQNAETIAQLLSRISNPGVIAQLQQMLFYGGFYDAGVKTLSDIQLGQFSTADETALGHLILAGGRTGQALGTYLTTAAATGYAQGNYLNPLGSTSNPVIYGASHAEEDTALRGAAMKLLGHLPSAEDLAGFEAVYDQAYQAGQKASLQAQQQQQQTLGNLPSASDLGGAMQRQGLLQGMGIPGNEAPPQFNTQRYYDPDARRMLTQQVPNPAYAAWQQQQQKDQATVNTLGTAADSLTQPVVGDNPYLPRAGTYSSAAEQYLYAHEGAQIAQQNVATKYAKLLQIIGG